MARRKKTHKRTGRRRKVGGIGNNIIMMGVAAIGGGVVGRLIGTYAASFMPSTMNATTKSLVGGLVPTAGGLFAASKVSSPAGKAFGLGMAASGGVMLVQSTGMLSGIGAATPMLAGYNRHKRVGAMPGGTPMLAGGVGTMSTQMDSTRLMGALM